MAYVNDSKNVFNTLIKKFLFENVCFFIKYFAELIDNNKSSYKA
jgi:hypothetical protein